MERWPADSSDHARQLRERVASVGGVDRLVGDGTARSIVSVGFDGAPIARFDLRGSRRTTGGPAQAPICSARHPGTGSALAHIRLDRSAPFDSSTVAHTGYASSVETS